MLHGRQRPRGPSGPFQNQRKWQEGANGASAQITVLTPSLGCGGETRKEKEGELRRASLPPPVREEKRRVLGAAAEKRSALHGREKKHGITARTRAEN